VCLSTPVSNAWPERGASALKRLKTRLRNPMKNNMLQALLQIVINRPPESECSGVVLGAVKRWKETKKRRNLPRCTALGARGQGNVSRTVNAGVQCCSEDIAMEISSALQSFQCDVPSDSEDSMSDSSSDEE